MPRVNLPTDKLRKRLMEEKRRKQNSVKYVPGSNVYDALNDLDERLKKLEEKANGQE